MAVTFIASLLRLNTDYRFISKYSGWWEAPSLPQPLACSRIGGGKRVGREPPAPHQGRAGHVHLLVPLYCSLHNCLKVSAIFFHFKYFIFILNIYTNVFIVVTHKKCFRKAKFILYFSWSIFVEWSLWLLFWYIFFPKNVNSWPLILFRRNTIDILKHLIIIHYKNWWFTCSYYISLCII